MPTGWIRLKSRDLLPRRSPLPSAATKTARQGYYVPRGHKRGRQTMVHGTGYLVIGVVAFAIGVLIVAFDAFCTVPH